MTRDIDEIARDLAKHLTATGRRIVFAESCTGGTVAATLAKIAGISRWLCGSAVVYREATKIAWLGVSSDTLARHTAVSAEIAEEMARGILANTPEADLAVSITGHLGPDAPMDLDGVVYVAVAKRTEPAAITVRKHLLRETSRVARQNEAAALVLETCAQALDATSPR
jgi:nicotinamide-nucleotide amidase